VQSFSIRNRPNDLRKDEVPGPGDYNVDLSPTKDRIQSFKIGSGQ
jgi:hypothetical protein